MVLHLGRKHVLKKFILSYLLIFVVLIIPLVISCMQSIDRMRTNIESYELASLARKQMAVDLHMEEIEMLVNDLSLNRRIVSYAYSSPSDQTFYDKMQLALTELSRAKATNPYIYDIALYHFKGKKLLTSSGIYDLPNAQRLVMAFENEQYEGWLSVLQSAPAYVPAKRLSIVPYTLVLQSYQAFPNYTPSDKALGTLVLMLDADKLSGALCENGVLEDSATYILDAQNQILLKSGEAHYLLENLPTLNERGIAYTVSNKEKLFVISVPSTFSDWRYVFVASEEQLMQPMAKVEHSVYLLIFLCSIFGLLGIVLCSHYNYRPIQSTVLKLERAGAGKALGDEMKYISNAISQQLQEIDSLQQRLESYLPVLRNSARYQLLYVESEDPAELEASLTEANLVFRHSFFCVILAELSGNDSEAELASPALWKLAFKSLSDQQLRQLGSAHTLSVGAQSIAVLLNLDLPRAEALPQYIQPVLKTLRQELEQRYAIVFNAGISCACTEITDIHNAYLEAQKALEYNDYHPSGWMQFWQEVQNYNQSSFYQEYKEQALMSALKLGNREMLEKQIDQLIERYTSGEQKLSLEAARCQFYGLISTVLKLIGSLDISVSQVLDGEDPMERLTECRNLSKLCETIRALLLRICDSFAQLHVPRKDHLMTRLLRYINNNYANPDLSLTIIAEAFDLTPTYIAHFLKQQGTQTFLEIVREARVKQAKRLLNQTDDTLNAIAHAVGYADALVLNRNFKKVVGMTPIQYRAYSQQDISAEQP